MPSAILQNTNLLSYNTVSSPSSISSFFKPRSFNDGPCYRWAYLSYIITMNTWYRGQIMIRLFTIINFLLFSRQCRNWWPTLINRWLYARLHLLFWWWFYLAWSFGFGGVGVEESFYTFKHAFLHIIILTIFYTQFSSIMIDIFRVD